MGDIAKLKRMLDGIRIEDNPAIVKQKSRDFYWYSPVLKRQLEQVVGDLIVSPRDEAEVIRVLAAAHECDVPVTTRGAGTGNYGQAMPLSGGVVMSVADLNGIGAIRPGSVVCGAGALMWDIDQATRAASGQELRLRPSTCRTATVGGFIAGGSGGIGSINWGGLRDLGNIIRARVVTCEANPRVMDLSGDDLAKVAHAYGTNGVITEVEMPLEAAYDWVDVIVGFDDVSAAARFANELGCQDGILVKEIAVVGAPAPHDYFLRHQKFLRKGQSVVITMVAPHGMGAFATFAARKKAEIVFRSDTATEAELKGLPPAFEMVWNHTTLRALRVDPSITYLQVLHPFPTQLESFDRVVKLFGDELIPHLEFVRFDGNVTCFGLPMVRFSTEERLEEIMRLHEDNGCPIFNPHRYTLEEGGMKQSDPIQLAFKREADPRGLLNPGKMIAWEDPDFDFGSGKLFLFPGLEAMAG